MKSILVLLFILVSTQVHADARGNVFCRVKKKVLSALSEEGREMCAGDLMVGKACFTGSRSQVIGYINNGTFNWDEEWLENAHFQGTTEISYEFVDGPNDVREKLTLLPCGNEFFWGI